MMNDLHTADSRWGWSARLVLAWGIFVLVLSSIGVFSNFSHLGEWTLGAFTTWEETNKCQIVNMLTPPTWPALQKDVFRVGDCIRRVNDYELKTQKDAYGLADYLATQVDDQGLPRPHVEVERKGEAPFETEAPMMQLTWKRLLSQILVLLVTGLSMWLLGLVVLLAQPQSEANRVWAAFLFMGELVITGALIRILDDHYRWIYVFLAISGPRPFLGALLFHLSLVYPRPVRLPLRSWLRYAGYLPALLVSGAIAVLNYGIVKHSPWVSKLDAWVSLGVILVFGAGVLMLLTRTAWVALRVREPQYVYPARVMLLAWVLALPMSFLGMILENLNLPWMAHTSNLTFMFWVVPATSLIAYAMLRYQAFAYRGKALNGLMIWFSSAFIAQFYAGMVAPLGMDGLQFIVLLGAVLLVTYLWSSDTPLRRRFQRLVMRHEYDYTIINHFSRRMASATDLDACLRQTLSDLCQSLDVAWAAVWVMYRPGTLYVAQAGQDHVQELSADAHTAIPLLPYPPTGTQTLQTGAQKIGMAWVGARTTAEPFDERDQQLLALLALAWSQSLAIHVQMETLAQAPGRILSAIEVERRRIGQDLHDGVLQFLGVIPMELDRAAAYVPQQSDKALAILRRNAERAESISIETRAIVYDLYPPSLAHGGLSAQARLYASQGCQTHHVQLAWRGQSDGWEQLSQDQAIQVYRIFQQALANAWAHACARYIWVEFKQEAGHFLMTVRDDGRGFAPQKEEAQHLGLITMRERARAIGARLQVNSYPGQGTTVRLSVS